MRSADLKLSGWGNYTRPVCKAYRPERQSDLVSTFREAHGTVIARGLGRSYGDPALNADGAVILCQRLNRFIELDEANATVTCEAGVNYRELIQAVLPRGLFPVVTPGTQFVTMGGAIAADVHGKNHHVDGTLGRHVIEFDLLTPDGQTRRCSRDENADLFFATLGGMGLTGVLQQAKLRLLRVPSAYADVNYQLARSLDEALDLFAADEARHRFSVAWIDCLAEGESLGRSVLMSGDFVKPAELDPDLRGTPYLIRPRRIRSLPFDFPAFALNRLSVKLFNKLYYGRHSNEQKIVDYQSFFYPLDSVLHWNRAYGKRGFIQYQALFPSQSSRNGLRRLLEVLSSAGAASFLAVLKSTGEQGEGMLSYPFKGHTLALDIPNRRGLAPLLEQLDRIVLDHGGRLYLAKDATMSAESFRQMYPRLPEFLDVRRRIDPTARLASDQARRLNLV